MTKLDLKYIPKTLATELRARLIEEYGEYNYYRYCRGEFLTPPAVQETILRIAKELGIPEPIQVQHESGNAQLGKCQDKQERIEPPLPRAPEGPR